jgi:D-lactate dehydrogenase
MEKVVFYSACSYDQTSFDMAFKNKFESVYIDQAISKETIVYAKGAYAVCVFVNDVVDEIIIDELVKLNVKGILVRAAGHDQVKHLYAQSKGIEVANVPSYSPNAVAEHTIALMMACIRKIPQANASAKKYDFSISDFLGFDIYKKKVGIIGMGKIGSISAKIINGFGAQLLAFDPKPNLELTKGLEIQWVDIEELIANSDIILIHAPLNEHTKYLINRTHIQQMKKGVVIVNTGRGAVINTEDLLEGLNNQQVSAVGLDVYEKEKGVFFYDRTEDNPNDSILDALLNHPNAVVTSHMAFLTVEALKNISDACVNSLEAWKLNQKSPTTLT